VLAEAEIVYPPALGAIAAHKQVKSATILKFVVPLGGFGLRTDVAKVCQ
jgi:hypothetical protein